MLPLHSADALTGRPHSRQGIASFVYGLFVLALVATALLGSLLAGRVASSPRQAIAFATLVGGALAGAAFGSVAALVLGLVGLARRDCRPTLAVWGVVVNGVFLFALLALLAAGF